MPNTPEQQIRRRRFESVIGLMAPVLDLVLATGERVSRVLAPEEDEYFAIRAPGDKLELGSIRTTRGPAPDE
jgi:hypothetical protein